MAKLSDLSDDLLVKILTFLPTKAAVSTSVLSKQWEFLWMWLPKLEFKFTTPPKYACLRDFIAKNLPLHKAPIIESLHLSSSYCSIQPEDLKSWVGIAVSRCVRELCIPIYSFGMERAVPLPCSLYSCNSLLTLKLCGQKTLVDVPGTVCLPSLKILELRRVTYPNDDSIRLLLSNCLVLEDLTIYRRDHDNVRKLVIIVPSLQRLSLEIPRLCSPGRYVIGTPSLKNLEVKDYRVSSSYLIEQMLELEEAVIMVVQDPEELLESITFTKRLSLRVIFNRAIEKVYRDGIVFNRLENLKVYRCCDDWSKSLFQLLKVSPNLRVLSLIVDSVSTDFGGYYEPVSWSNNQSSVPKCLSKSLETFEFAGYMGTREERDFLSFIFKHACHLKSLKILRGPEPHHGSYLEDLTIYRRDHDNVRKLVIIVPSLQRLSLEIPRLCSPGRYVIGTPSLKNLEVKDYRVSSSYLIEQMLELEEAVIMVVQDPEELLESITFTKRLSLRVIFNRAIEKVYRDGIVFNRLENLKVYRCCDDWSKSLFQLLKVSPNLRVLSLIVDSVSTDFGGYYEPVSWSNNQSSVPKCLSKSLETFEFAGYMGTREERDFLSFIFKHACHLKSLKILRGPEPHHGSYVRL
ncbi:PREDICTED: putative FBD-associated F-box protein At5g56700 [Camelina sativa]|uniref:FBD-associated F-box protein At5g56700 n=1 Tax=Camelina sativa TaxID=90675 RepID=A0ABM1QLL7_CAMSA|nr:PREDICTED: putative FBD-associated F-box protein At5g56700 [Camelina sativa]